VDPAVVEEMMPFLTELYGNPSSGYRFGQKVGKALAPGAGTRGRVAGLRAERDHFYQLRDRIDQCGN